MKLMLKLSSRIFILSVLWCGTATILAAPNPTEVIKLETNKILSVLTASGLNKTQRHPLLQKEIRRVVDERFDFRSMSKSVLSTNWRKATGYERDRFIDFFTQSLVRTYYDAIESYTGGEIKYVAEKHKGDRAVVDTIIMSKTVDIPVSYKLKLNDGEWYVYDVVIEQVSLVSNYRNLYNAIIKIMGGFNLSTFVDGLF